MDREIFQDAKGAPFFCRVGNVFGARSPESAQDVKRIISFLSPKLRGIIFEDLSVPELSISHIRKTNLFIGSQILGHYSNPLSLEKIERPHPIASESLAYEQFARELNAEILIAVAQILEPEIRVFLKSIPLDDTLDYTLEANLVDFLHELASPLLQERLRLIQDAKKALLENSSLETEKTLVLERHLLFQNCEALFMILKRVLGGVPKALNEKVALFLALANPSHEGALQRLAKDLNLGIVILGDLDNPDFIAFLQACDSFV